MLADMHSVGLFGVVIAAAAAIGLEVIRLWATFTDRSAPESRSERTLEKLFFVSIGVILVGATLLLIAQIGAQR